MYFMGNASLMQKYANIYGAAAQGTNNKSVYEAYLNIQLKPFVETLMSHVNKTMTYTVQAADIDKPDDTNFILKMKSEWVQ